MGSMRATGPTTSTDAGGGGAKTFEGARVKLKANQTLSNSTPAPVSFAADGVEFDTSSFWASGQPTRLTIPAAVSLVRLHAQVQWGNQDNGLRATEIHKNGVIDDGSPKTFSKGASTSDQNITSGAISVVEGDYFEVQCFQTSGGNLDIVFDSGRTWFEIEVLAN